MTTKPRQNSRSVTRRSPALIASSPRKREAAQAGSTKRRAGLDTVALFAGIGGIELGLSKSGHRTSLFCEIDEGARAVLRARFEDGVRIHDDVRTLKTLPASTELLTAGFPCQDLSQAGKTAGITGARSGLVGEVFRLLESHEVPRVLVENVPFMLQLGRGKALSVIIDALERLGYDWAYRVVDTRAFGLPQRRERVFILASRVDDPRNVLLADDAGEPEPENWSSDRAFGFYWTEGIRGLGAAIDAVPTLKGGSTIGIPSSPAILLPSGDVVTPSIKDAERMQGFSADWTKPAESVVRGSFRWKLVGNAVTVDIATWIGKRLVDPAHHDHSRDEPLEPGRPWPRAAWSIKGKRFKASASSWPVSRKSRPIQSFLKFPTRPLSERATAGFLSRARSSSLRFPDGFLGALELHLDRMKRLGLAASTG